MEKTVTFNVTDALISPLGLAMLTGAGLADADASNAKHVHTTVDAVVDNTGVAKVSLATLIDELGLNGTTDVVEICTDDKVKVYATVLDHNGAITGWIDEVEVQDAYADATPAEFKVDAAYAGNTIKLDFYCVMFSGVTEITVAPEDFGGTFYVEADTLYRNQDGKDMAATLTFPKAKIQSGFTIAMAPTGDPSTFDFVMDAMPGYTYFDSTKKVVCDITIVGGDTAAESGVAHTKPLENVNKLTVANVAIGSADGVVTGKVAVPTGFSADLSKAVVKITQGGVDVTAEVAAPFAVDAAGNITGTISGNAATGDYVVKVTVNRQTASATVTAA